MSGTFTSTATMDDIGTMVEAMNTEHRVAPANKAAELMRGDLRFLSLMPGCFMHWCDVVELRDAASTSELEPCLSFTLLIKGRIHFALSDNQYLLDANPYPVCSLIKLNRAELMTRHTQAGVSVRKINVMVNEKWLLSRCATDYSMKHIQQLLSGDQNVHIWQAEEGLVELAEAVLNLNPKGSLRDRLSLEETVFKFIGIVIEKFENGNIPSSLDGDSFHVGESFQVDENFQTSKFPVEDNNLKQMVDKACQQNLDLECIACELGMSVSTLQRKFREAYGLTVMSYVRQQRLELARRAILFEGKSIGEASYLAGYNHPSNFINAFKKRFNTTPKRLVNRVG